MRRREFGSWKGAYYWIVLAPMYLSYRLGTGTQDGGIRYNITLTHAELMSPVVGTMYWIGLGMKQSEDEYDGHGR
jgi:hypothetical protein